MANVIQSTLIYDANLTSAMSQVKALTAEVGALTTSMNAADAAALRMRANMAAAFAANLGAMGGFRATMTNMTTAAEAFGKRLSQNKLTMREYFAEAYNGIRKQDSLMRQFARNQARYMESIAIPMGRTGVGTPTGMVITPSAIDMRNMQTRMNVANQQFTTFRHLVNSGAQEMINFGKNTQWTGRQLTVGLTMPVMLFGAAFAKTFMDIDKELTRFSKVYGNDVVNSTVRSTEKMKQSVIDLAKTISSQYGIAMKETVALAADVAATGQEGQALLDTVAQTSRLAVLGEVDRQEAMKATLAIQTAFKQNTNELAESINFLNAIENQTSTTLNDLVEAIPKAGPVIKGLGGSIKDLSVLMVAMKEGGIPAAEAANAIKSGMASLINPTKKASDTAKQFGVDLEGIVKTNKGQLMPTLFAVQKALDGLDSFAKSRVIEEIFGKYQFARISALFNNLGKAGSQTQQAMELAGASTTDLAAIANRELKAYTESTTVRFQRMVETVKNQLVPLGENLLKILTPALEGVSKVIGTVSNLLEKIPEPLKNFMGIIGGFALVAGPALMLIGLFKQLIGNGLKAAMSVATLGAKLMGLKPGKLEVLDEQAMAAKLGIDRVTVAFESQEVALRGLNIQLQVYLDALKRAQISNPQMFRPPIGQVRQPLRRQKGGPIPGYGGGDIVPTVLEPGEFVVTKEATAKNRQFLTMINGGRGVARFADGTPSSTKQKERGSPSWMRKFLYGQHAIAREELSLLARDIGVDENVVKRYIRRDIGNAIEISHMQQDLSPIKRWDPRRLIFATTLENQIIQNLVGRAGGSGEKLTGWRLATQIAMDEVIRNNPNENFQDTKDRFIKRGAHPTSAKDYKFFKMTLDNLMDKISSGGVIDPETGKVIPLRGGLKGRTRQGLPLMRALMEERLATLEGGRAAIHRIGPLGQSTGFAIRNPKFGATPSVFSVLRKPELISKIPTGIKVGAGITAGTLLLGTLASKIFPGMGEQVASFFGNIGSNIFGNNNMQYTNVPSSEPTELHQKGGMSMGSPALVEPGEFIINANAAAKYRPILDAMNRGDIPGYEEGTPPGTQRAHVTAPIQRTPGEILALPNLAPKVLKTFTMLQAMNPNALYNLYNNLVLTMREETNERLKNNAMNRQAFIEEFKSKEAWSFVTNNTRLTFQELAPVIQQVEGALNRLQGEVIGDAQVYGIMDDVIQRLALSGDKAAQTLQILASQYGTVALPGGQRERLGAKVAPSYKRPGNIPLETLSYVDIVGMQQGQRVATSYLAGLQKGFDEISRKRTATMAAMQARTTQATLLQSQLAAEKSRLAGFSYAEKAVFGRQTQQKIGYIEQQLLSLKQQEVKDQQYLARLNASELQLQQKKNAKEIEILSLTEIERQQAAAAAGMPNQIQPLSQAKEKSAGGGMGGMNALFGLSMVASTMTMFMDTTSGATQALSTFSMALMGVSSLMMLIPRGGMTGFGRMFGREGALGRLGARGGLPLQAYIAETRAAGQITGAPLGPGMLGPSAPSNRLSRFMAGAGEGTAGWFTRRAQARLESADRLAESASRIRSSTGYIPIGQRSMMTNLHGFGDYGTNAAARASEAVYGKTSPRLTRLAESISTRASALSESMRINNANKQALKLQESLNRNTENLIKARTSVPYSPVPAGSGAAAYFERASGPTPGFRTVSIPQPTSRVQDLISRTLQSMRGSGALPPGIASVPYSPVRPGSGAAAYFERIGGPLPGLRNVSISSALDAQKLSAVAKEFPDKVSKSGNRFANLIEKSGRGLDKVLTAMPTKLANATGKVIGIAGEAGARGASGLGRMSTGLGNIITGTGARAAAGVSRTAGMAGGAALRGLGAISGALLGIGGIAGGVLVALAAVGVGIYQYNKSLEEARQRAISAFADPVKTVEYFGKTMKTVKDQVIETSIALQAGAENVSQIDQSLRDAVKQDYSRLIERVAGAPAEAGAKQLAIAFNKMLLSGLSADEAKASIQAIAMEAGNQGGQAFGIAMRQGMLKEMTPKEMIDKTKKIFDPTQNANIQLKKNLEEQRNILYEERKKLEDEANSSLLGFGAVIKYLEPTYWLANTGTYVGRSFTSEAFYKLAQVQDQLENINSEVTQLEDIDSSQLVGLTEQFYELFKLDPSGTIQALDELNATARSLGDIPFDPAPIQKYLTELDAFAGASLARLIASAGDNAENMSQQMMKAVTAGITPQEILNLIKTKGLDSLDVAVQLRVRVTQTAIDLEKAKQDLQDFVEKDMQDLLNAGQVNLDNIAQERQDYLDERQKEKEQLDKNFEDSQRQAQDEIDLLDKQLNKLQDFTNKYINLIKKRSEKESYYLDQRKRNMSALSALASGDIFGFLSAREEARSADIQRSYDLEIQKIEERRDSEVKALQKQIDKKQELMDLASQGHQDAMDAFDKETKAHADSLTRQYNRQKSSNEEMQGLIDELKSGNIASFRDVSIAFKGELDKRYKEQVDNLVKSTKVSLQAQVSVGTLSIENARKSLFDIYASYMGLSQLQIDKATRTFEDVKKEFGITDFIPYQPIQGTGTTETESGSSVNLDNVTDMTVTATNVTINGVTAAAGGGYISGPGTKTSDSIPARLSNGEYVIRASSVDKYGKGMLNAINEGRFVNGGIVQGFAGGGYPIGRSVPKDYKGYVGNPLMGLLEMAGGIKDLISDEGTRSELIKVIKEDPGAYALKTFMSMSIPFFDTLTMRVNNQKDADIQMASFLVDLISLIPLGGGITKALKAPVLAKGAAAIAAARRAKVNQILLKDIGKGATPMFVTNLAQSAATQSYGSSGLDYASRLYGAKSLPDPRSVFNSGGLASYGYISGGGTSLSDSIPARLSNGEYVIRASSVEKYGIPMMDSINSGRFNMGGLAGSYSSPKYNIRTRMGYAEGGLAESYSSNNTYNITINGAGISDPNALANIVVRKIQMEESRRNHSRSVE